MFEKLQIDNSTKNTEFKKYNDNKNNLVSSQPKIKNEYKKMKEALTYKKTAIKTLATKYVMLRILVIY